MKSIRDVFSAYKQSLSKLYDNNEIEALTLMVINEITGSGKAQIKAFPEKDITSDQSENLNNILTKLQTGEPIQYILGYTEFYGLPFKVNPSVLIPRPETEELVEWALSEVKSQKSKVKILDIGTGSGCIAISLKKNLPDAEIFAIDISITALETARQNADLNEVDITFIEIDILNVQGSHSPLTNPYSLIISNPPYVTLHDKTQMHTNVTDFEPHSALFIPENDLLIFYKAIANFAIENLTPGGLLFFEVNENYGEQTVELLKNKSFINIELRKDMSGRYRMIRVTRL
jgi:release factor glutamine methyltransferase